MKNAKPNIIVILGPTASGKSDLAVELARALNGEVISADSRQVYRGLDIGTGKITKKEMRGVPHHLLDVASPTSTYTVVKYKKDAERAISNILKRGKLPIICGGTGFYIQALVDNILLPDVPANKKMRAALQKKSSDELMKMIKKLDPARAKELDPHNKVRIIRAIEIARALGKVPQITSHPLYNALQIGILIDPEKLRERIHMRLKKRMRQGMLAEAKKLHSQGISWKRMNELGLEYRYMALHLQKFLSKQEMLTKLESEIWAYARRQMTWFRKDKQIVWMENNEKKILNRATQFLK